MPVTSTVNGVDLDRLSATIDVVQADPALARFQFRAGKEDATRTQPFTVDSDEPPVLLGENQAPNAGEYLLHALAACLTGTIAYHAAARGIRPGYEQIRVTIKVAGAFDDDQLAELASLTRPGHRQQPRPRRHRRNPRLSDRHDVRAAIPTTRTSCPGARRTTSAALGSPARPPATSTVLDSMAAIPS